LQLWKKELARLVLQGDRVEGLSLEERDGEIRLFETPSVDSQKAYTDRFIETMGEAEQYGA
jgi:hypothetical protein